VTYTHVIPQKSNAYRSNGGSYRGDFMKRWAKFGGVIAVVGVMTAGGVAYAASSTDQTIHGCVDQNGNLRVISAKESCKFRETALNWNQNGQPGPVGPQGPAGKDGVSGGATPQPNSVVVGQVTFDGLQGGDPAADSFDIVSYSLQETQTASSNGGGGGAGKVNFSDFKFVKKVDTASPVLLVNTASGKHIPTATVSIYKPGTTTANNVYKFDDVQLTEVKSHDEGAQGNVPLEDVAFTYSRIKQTYTPSSGDSVVGGWDTKTNVKL
jgi:type VI secretion system secreted protein Hcp